MHLVHLLSPRLRQTRLPSFIARIATELYRHLLGWNFHPLVLSAFVAHPNVANEPRGACIQRPRRLHSRVSPPFGIAVESCTT